MVLHEASNSGENLLSGLTLMSVNDWQYDSPSGPFFFSDDEEGDADIDDEDNFDDMDDDFEDDDDFDDDDDDDFDDDSYEDEDEDFDYEEDVDYDDFDE